MLVVNLLNVRFFDKPIECKELWAITKKKHHFLFTNLAAVFLSKTIENPHLTHDKTNTWQYDTHPIMEEAILLLWFATLILGKK